MAPKVSVVMAVHNGERYLRESVDSILNQEFSDFEFIIVDDASTDSTAAILDSYTDPRIVRLLNPGRMRLARSLNNGLRIARGEFVARQDADDVALLHRLEKQVSFLEKHREIGILGTPCQLIDATGRVLGVYRVPTSSLQVQWRSLLANPFAHPAVMIRLDLLTRNGLRYHEDLQAAQDYDLWTRVLRYTRGANLGEPLLKRRVHDESITSKSREIQLKNNDIIALRVIGEQLLGFSITLEQVSQLRALFGGEGSLPPDLDVNRPALADLYLDLFEAFAELHSGKPGLKALHRHQALRATHRVLQPPLRPGWAAVVRRVMTIPGLPWSAICRLLVLG